MKGSASGPPGWKSGDGFTNRGGFSSAYVYLLLEICGNVALIMRICVGKTQT